MNALGIHLTGRVARSVLVDEQGTVLASARAESSNPAGAAEDAARQSLGTSEVSRIGLAVDPLEGLGHAAVSQQLAALGSVRVVAAGASSIAAEVWAGAAVGARNAVSLWIGDTVLAGLLLEGQPWPGAHGLAGSVAWLALNPVERQDYRKLGSLAAEVSHPGMVRRLAWRIQAGDESTVRGQAGDLADITAAQVFDGARRGDGVSVSVVREVAKYIGMAIANLANAIDPDVVVLAGPIASAGDLLRDPIRQECARCLPPPLAEQFRFEISPLGADGIAIGAARLAMVGPATAERPAKKQGAEKGRAPGKTRG